MYLEIIIFRGLRINKPI